MHLDQLKIGEMYCLDGRRARLDKIERVAGGDSARFRPYDESCPYLQVTLSVGRSFEKQRVLLSSRYAPDSINQIRETWQERKERLGAEKADREQLKSANQDFHQALEAVGLKGGYADGRWITIPGGAQELRRLTAILASHEEQAGGEELGELLV